MRREREEREGDLELFADGRGPVRLVVGEVESLRHAPIERNKRRLPLKKRKAAISTSAQTLSHASSAIRHGNHCECHTDATAVITLSTSALREPRAALGDVGAAAASRMLPILGPFLAARTM